jgi:hypothetical protein
MLPVTTWFALHRILPTIQDDFQFFDFDVKASFDAAFYLVGLRYTLFGEYDLSLYYFYRDIRVEQPMRRYRQITGRELNFEVDHNTVPQWPVDAGINPRGGKAVSFQFTYAHPWIKEPFTGAKMGTDLADFFNDPGTNWLNENAARTRPGENYLLPDYGFWRARLNWRNYLEFPFWDLTGLNDVEWLQWTKFDWSKLNFERWKRQRHTLVIKALAGFTHSNVPEGYGWGNSYGRVNSYDRFTGGGMYVSPMGAYSENSAFLGYDSYWISGLEGETVAILGADYVFPVVREIDAGFWGFYFDKFYMAVFGNVGNFWPHVTKKEHLFNLNYVFDKNYDGKFTPKDDLISDVGIEFRLSAYLFSSNWDSFLKIAHGFQDHENDDPPLGVPLRFYFGLGTGFECWF